jgi:hypothetical protein
MSPGPHISYGDGVSTTLTPGDGRAYNGLEKSDGDMDMLVLVSCAAGVLTVRIGWFRRVSLDRPRGRELVRANFCVTKLDDSPVSLLFLCETLRV